MTGWSASTSASFSINVALLRPNGTGIDEDRIPNTPEAVRSLVRRWADPGSVRACYEAGPTGYALYPGFRSC